MTVEELTFKMGMDGSGLERGLRNAKDKVVEFGSHASEHLDRAATSGRMLHKVIEEIGKVSPLAGAAVVGAFSLPLLAAEGLLMVITKIKDHFDEAKKSAHESMEAYQKQIEALGDAQERARSVREEMSRRAAEGEPSGPDVEKRIHDATVAEAAVKRLTALTEQQTKAEREKEAALHATGVSAREIEEAKREAGGREVKGPEKGFLNPIQEAVKLSDEYDKARMAVEQTNKELERQKGIVERAKEAVNDETKARKQMEEVAESQKQLEELTAEDEKHYAEEKKKEQDKATAFFFENMDHLDEQEQKQLRYNQERARLGRELKHLEDAPFETGSLAELGKFNTPYGQIAREIGLGRTTTKELNAQATPEERAQLQAEYANNLAQGRAAFAAAGTDPHKQAAAVEKYTKGLQDILSGHHQNPEQRAIDEGMQALKDFNERSKGEGLVIRSADDGS